MFGIVLTVLSVVGVVLVAFDVIAHVLEAFCYVELKCLREF